MSGFLRHFICFTLTLTICLVLIPYQKLYTFDLSKEDTYISSDICDEWHYTVNFHKMQMYIAVFDKNSESDSQLIITVENHRYTSVSFHNNVASLTADLSSLSEGIHQASIYQGTDGIYSLKDYFYINNTDSKLSPYSPYEVNELKWQSICSESYTESDSLDNPAYSKIIESAKEITKYCDSDLDRLTAIHQYICSNYSYDTTAADSASYDKASSPEWMYENKRGLCSGFSHLACIMLEAVGIPCQCVKGCGLTDSKAFLSGSTASAVNHEWNVVYINGSWYGIDFTWDCKNKYYGCNSGKNLTGQPVSYTYFCPNPKFFGMDHLTLKLCGC